MEGIKISCPQLCVYISIELFLPQNTWQVAEKHNTLEKNSCKSEVIIEMPGNHHWTINKNFSKRAQYGFPYLYHFPTCIPVHMWTIESIRTSMSNNLKTNPFAMENNCYFNLQKLSLCRWNQGNTSRFYSNSLQIY